MLYNCSGFGWVWYRPLVGLSLLGVSLVPYLVPTVRLLWRRREHRFAV